MLTKSMHCLYCDSDDHPWFNCRKKPDGWMPPQRPLMLPVSEKQPRTSEPQRTRNGDRLTKQGRPRSPEPTQGKSKRAAYMRDYMRRRRDAKQEAKDA